MTPINYHNRYFKSVSNSPNGEVDDSVVFHYRQTGDTVWGTYSGGAIQVGTLVAKTDAQGNLDMRYQHINHNGDIMTGQCQSTLHILADGRYRLEERWQWTSGDLSSGESVVEEFLP